MTRPRSCASASGPGSSPPSDSTISAQLGLYGGHDLRDLVEALGAIEHRFEGASVGIMGSLPGN